jgi:uncharacterized lipoprotein YddW (UPF0748 family)
MAQIFDPIPSQETRSPETPSVSQPIHALELIAMRQELQDLVGRVENALTAARIRQGQGNTLQLPAIAAARTVLKQLPQWVAARQYQEARQQWEQARQNLWRDYPPEAFVPVPEVRAIWLDRGTIVAAGSEERLAVVFDRLQAAGVNTVFLEVVNAGYPIYPSRVAPEQNPLIRRNWDPLASAVRLARARRMELHAWVWVFSVGNRRHNALVGKPASYPGPVLSRYPQWANRDQDGNIFAPEGKTFLDPSHPEVQQYLLSLYREIVTQYAVDGIHLDYIRQPRNERGITLGYGTAARSQFAQKTGIDPIDLTERDASLWWMWTEFRALAINGFVAKTAKELRQLRPQLTISAAVFPWSYNDRIQRLQQNWETWVSRGDIDLLMPMTYVPNTNRFVRQEVLPVVEAIAESPVLLLPGVMLRGLPDMEVVDQLQAVRDLPSGGYALFASEHFRPSFGKLLQQSPVSDEARVLPHRRPFRVAYLRFNDLRKEWQNLVASDRLWIREDHRLQWERQSQALYRSLDLVSQQPSPANISQARKNLTIMAENLPQWMRLEGIERPYRVATWRNRLESIEALLRYGEPRLRKINASLSTSQVP